MDFGSVKVHPAGRGGIAHSREELVREATGLPGPRVVFNRDVVIVGIGSKRTSETPAYPVPKPPAKPTYPYRLTATVWPGIYAPTIVFRSSNEERAQVGVGTIAYHVVDPKGGPATVTVVVTGVSETPPDPNDPTKPTKDDAFAIAERPLLVPPPRPPFDFVPVIVVKPTTQTHSAASEAQLLNTAERLFSGAGTWVTSTVTRDVTVTVHDQFGAPLHSVYDGPSIEEQFPDLNLVPAGMVQRPPETWQAMGDLRAGAITDHCYFGVLPLLIGGIWTDQQIGFWRQGVKVLNLPTGQGTNLFAVKGVVFTMDGTQHIRVDGMEVPPAFQRHMEMLPNNVLPGGEVPFTVTEQAVQQ